MRHSRRELASSCSGSPGSSSQPHDHTCHVQFVMIEGELTKFDGHTYRAGDVVPLKARTGHFSTMTTGTALVAFVRELEKCLSLDGPAPGMVTNPGLNAGRSCDLFLTKSAA